MRATRMIVQASLVIGLTGAAASAGAAQYENINGSGCNSLYPADTSFGTSVYHDAGALRNANTAFRYATCPIPRVQALSTGGWYSWVIANDGTHQLWCSATTLDEFGNYVSSSPSVTIPAGSGAQLLTLGMLPSTVWGYLNIFCTLPSGASILQAPYVEY